LFPRFGEVEMPRSVWSRRGYTFEL